MPVKLNPNLPLELILRANLLRNTITIKVCDYSHLLYILLQDNSKSFHINYHSMNHLNYILQNM